LKGGGKKIVRRFYRVVRDSCLFILKLNSLIFIGVGELYTVHFKEGCAGIAACTSTGGGSGYDCEEAFGPYGLKALVLG